MEDDHIQDAEAFRRSHGLSETSNRRTTSDHPLVEALREYLGNAQLLANDRNQAFTQIRMDNFAKGQFTDETKDFALAYEYALHPLNEVQEELEQMGIMETKKITRTIQNQGVDQEVSEIKDVPIIFEVTILKNFIDEWLRKRVPANRMRVKEYIDMFNKSNSFSPEQMIRPSTTPEEPAGRRRLF